MSGAGGVCFGGSALGGSAPGGVCSGGVSAPRGVSAPWGCLLLGGSAPGGSAPRGEFGIPACIEVDPPPVNRMTDRCKNITLATTSLRAVINGLYCTKWVDSHLMFGQPLRELKSSRKMKHRCE